MMRIYTEHTGALFQVGAARNISNRSRSDEMQKAGVFMRADTAAISPQGKAANLLTNLMNQRELIQMNKDALIKRTLDDENGISSAGLKEQLEDYEEQLDKLDGQIAAEMAKQAENTDGKDSTYQNTRNMTAQEKEEAFPGLAKMSAEFENTGKAGQVIRKREGEKRVCEAEIELSGSEAARHKLDRINKLERLTSQVMPLMRDFMGR